MSSPQQSTCDVKTTGINLCVKHQWHVNGINSKAVTLYSQGWVTGGYFLTMLCHFLFKYCFSATAVQLGKCQNDNQPVSQWHLGCHALLGWPWIYFSHDCIVQSRTNTTVIDKEKTKITINLYVDSIEADMPYWSGYWFIFSIFKVAAGFFNPELYNHCCKGRNQRNNQSLRRWL